MESFRWQLSKGKLEEVKNSLIKIAKSNGKSIPSAHFYSLQKIIIENTEKRQTISLTQMLKSNVLLLRFIIFIFLWITCALLFYGLSLSSFSLAGNDYLNFFMVSLIEIPAYWLILLVEKRFERKTLLIGSYFLTSASCFSFIFFGSEGEFRNYN